MFTIHANNGVFRNIARFINNHKNKVKKVFFGKLDLSLHIYLRAFFAYCKIQKRAEVRSFPYCYLYNIGKRPTS